MNWTAISAAACAASYLAWYAALRRRNWTAVNWMIAAVFVSTVLFLVSLHK